MKETFGYYELAPGRKCDPTGEQWIELLNAAVAYIQELERERDELYRDVSLESSCSSCKHVGTKLRKNPCRECLQDITTKCHWEWRGVKLDESQESE